MSILGGINITKLTLIQGLIALAGFFVFGSNAAQAATNLNGYPSGAGGLMSLANSPYIVTGDIAVNNGNTLTIQPGVVVKMQANRAIILLNGNIIIGSASNPSPVVITSYKDDAYGGDTNADGAATSPSAGDWKYIQASSASSHVTINNALIRYGGSSSAMIQVLSDAQATIASSTIEYSNNTALGIRNGATTLTLTNSIIRHAYEGLTISFQADATITGSTFSNNRRGIAIDTDADVAHLTISGNTFFDNNWVTGVPTPAGLDFADVDDTLLAINNDWGSTTGPTIASNPSGTGDRIIGNVTYSPWTGQNAAPVLSYAATSGYVSDGVEPNISFKTQSVPLFAVAYSDADNQPPSYVNLVVATSTFPMVSYFGGTQTYYSDPYAFAKGTYSYHFEASDGVATARLPATGELSFEVKNIPVILVPGIMGTEMKKDGDLIWPDTVEMLRNPGDEFMNVLSVNTDGTFVDNQVALGDIVRSAPTKDIFAGLITEFVASGYQENTDLFVLPYDWRLDIRSTSVDLKNKINTVISQTGSSKVDIIAHSMGGLLSKQYILDNGSGLIDKLIFVGTPHLGAPKAAKTLLLGDDLGIRLLFAGLDDDRIKYISQNMPAIYQLLPSSVYFSQIGHYYSELGNLGIGHDYTSMRKYLIDSGLNLTLINDANSFHSSVMDNFDATGIDAYNITGCTTPTISSITKRTDFNNEYTLQMSAGDGTVPFGSANAINVVNGNSYYFKNHGFLDSVFPRIDHAELPSTSGIKELITDIITGSSVSLPDYATQNSSECKLEGEIVSLHSPVNIHIYDQDGNHVGRGENGDIDYNITGVAYEEIGENKFVFLPTSGGQTYQIELDGTGVGTYSLRVSKIEDNQVVETAYYSDLPVNTSTEATVTLAGNVSQTVLSVDQNGTGSFTPEPISAVLDSTQATDITQPASTISVAGGQTSATVSLSATDDNAGVLKIEYSLNNGATWNTYASSFIITSIGNTIVQYQSTDRAGNVETTKSREITVTAAPNAVISIPSSSATSPADSAGKPPQILGEQVERPANEQYTKDDILEALSQAKTEILLDYLNQVPNPTLEQRVAQDYGQGLSLDQPSINFIAYGTKSTQKLGLGERLGVLRSYQYAFGKLPQTAADWQDAVNIATNQLPVKRSIKAEQEARVVVRKIYGKIDSQSVMFIAYGLRPIARDIKKEQTELARFGRIFGKMPNSVFDWNVFRKLVY